VKYPKPKLLNGNWPKCEQVEETERSYREKTYAKTSFIQWQGHHRAPVATGIRWFAAGDAHLPGRSAIGISQSMPHWSMELKRWKLLPLHSRTIWQFDIVNQQSAPDNRRRFIAGISQNALCYR
jgi:hypothetical protein